MTDAAMDGLAPFYAMEILAEAKKLEGEGRDICYLQTGEPAAPPAPRVREAVRAVLDEPQRYTHSKGQIELRCALSDYYLRRHGAKIDPEQILVTMGSSAAFLLAFLGALERGARIAVTRPGYPAYLNIIAGLGLTPVEIEVFANDGWRLSPEQIVAAHKAMPFDALLFASPANPTGASVDAETLSAIADTCRKLGVRLISDEIYHGLDHVRRSASASEFGSDAVLINSFSKYYCMTGWRIGWMVLPEDLVRRTEILQQNLFISAPSLSQVAARVALEEVDYAEAQRAHYAQNRLFLAEGLKRLGLDNTPGDGAFYAYVDISRFSNDSLTFSKALLNEVGVATTPGIDFDRINGNRYVRFSYAGSEEMLAEALARMERFLAG